MLNVLLCEKLSSMRSKVEQQMAFNLTCTPRFLLMLGNIDCEFLISPDKIGVNKHSFQQWKYNYGVHHGALFSVFVSICKSPSH